MSSMSTDLMMAAAAAVGLQTTKVNLHMDIFITAAVTGIVFFRLHVRCRSVQVPFEMEEKSGPGPTLFATQKTAEVGVQMLGH